MALRSEIQPTPAPADWQAFAGCRLLGLALPSTSRDTRLCWGLLAGPARRELLMVRLSAFAVAALMLVATACSTPPPSAPATSAPAAAAPPAPAPTTAPAAAPA